MSYLKIDYNDYNDYEKLLTPPDPKLIQSNIINFLIHLRGKGKSPNTISTYLAAIKHFYDMNDFILNWKKIKSFQGEFYRVVDDEAYTAEQIKLLVDNADMRDKAIILLMTSTAFRKNIGRVLLSKQRDFDYLKVWDIDYTSHINKTRYSHLRNIDKEKDIESQITNLLRKAFYFRLIPLEG